MQNPIEKATELVPCAQQFLILLGRLKKANALSEEQRALHHQLFEEITTQTKALYSILYTAAGTFGFLGGGQAGASFDAFADEMKAELLRRLPAETNETFFLEALSACRERKRALLEKTGGYELISARNAWEIVFSLSKE